MRMAQAAMLSRKPTTAGGSRKLPRQLWWSVAVSLLFGPVLAASVALALYIAYQFV